MYKKERDEIWRSVPIAVFSHYYVSDSGRVKNSITGRILSPKRTVYGYLRVTLCNNKYHRTFGIHRLVALAFVENSENKPTVNHKNEVKNDNRAGNLEWATYAEQNTYGTRLKRAREHTDYAKRVIDYKTVASKHDYKKSHMYGRKKVGVTQNGEIIAVFDSQHEAAKYANISESRLSMCKKNAWLTQKGYGFIDISEKHFGDEETGEKEDWNEFIHRG